MLEGGGCRSRAPLACTSQLPVGGRLAQRLAEGERRIGRAKQRQPQRQRRGGGSGSSHGSGGGGNSGGGGGSTRRRPRTAFRSPMPSSSWRCPSHRHQHAETRQCRPPAQQHGASTHHLLQAQVHQLLAPLPPKHEQPKHRRMN